jgi:hypothetical protein
MGVPTMAEEGFNRKLAALLNAYVEGYGQLMIADEGSTIRTLTSFLTSTSFKLFNF